MGKMALQQRVHDKVITVVTLLEIFLDPSGRIANVDDAMAGVGRFPPGKVLRIDIGRHDNAAQYVRKAKGVPDQSENMFDISLCLHFIGVMENPE